MDECGYFNKRMMKIHMEETTGEKSQALANFCLVDTSCLKFPKRIHLAIRGLSRPNTHLQKKSILRQTEAFMARLYNSHTHTHAQKHRLMLVTSGWTKLLDLSHPRRQHDVRSFGRRCRSSWRRCRSVRRRPQGGAGQGPPQNLPD